MPMKIPYPCACHHTYDRALAFACPYCGLPAVSFQSSAVQEKPAITGPFCPDPLCIVGLVTPGPCEPCARKKLRGGKRPGAGAPLGNLNHLVHGRRSYLFRHGIVYLVENPDLHYILIILARFVLAGDFPQGTKSVFSQAVSRIKEAHHA